MLFPKFITKLLLFDITTYDDEQVIKRWGVLYAEFNTRKLAIMYYLAFFLRRLLLATSFILLKENPVAQIFTCSLSCMMVIYTQFLIYLIIVRPYKDRIQNILNILNEFAVTLGYSLYILFIMDVGIDHKIAGWMIIGCIGGTYLIQNFYIIYTLIAKIVTIIAKSYYAERITTPASSTYPIKTSMRRIFNIT